MSNPPYRASDARFSPENIGNGTTPEARISLDYFERIADAAHADSTSDQRDGAVVEACDIAFGETPHRHDEALQSVFTVAGLS